MPTTFDSQRLRNQRQMDKRLSADHAQLARAIANLVLRAAQPDGLIANTRAVREALRSQIWEQVLKPYYIGNNTDALKGAVPQSPYARLLVDGIEQATRIQAERQAAIVRRVVKDADVVAWLTGPRPLADILSVPISQMPSFPVAGIAFNPSTATIGALRGADGRIDVARAREALVKPRGLYSPFHEWIDPNGYRLSDRIWRTSVEVRSRVDLLMDYHIQRGTSAVEIAALLEPFLTPGGLTPRTRTPYGTEGSYSARRLARSEISVAAYRATINASIANPFVAGVQWRLSGRHPKIDICDQYARGGANGDGIYTPETVPSWPHPMCLCSQLPVPAGNTADLVESLRDDIRAAREGLINSVGGRSANALRGILSPDYLTRALMNGNLDEAVATAVQRARIAPIARLPRKVASTVQNAPMVQVPRFKDKKEAAAWMTSNGYAKTVDFGKIELSAIQEISDRAVYHMERFPKIKGQMEFIGSAQARNTLTREAARARLEQSSRELVTRMFPGSTPAQIEALTKSNVTKTLNLIAPRVPGDAWALAGERDMMFNEKFSKNIDDMVQGLIRSEKTGFHPPQCNTVSSVVDHEFGHILDNVYKITRADFGSPAELQTNAMRRLANDNGGTKVAVSTYAATNSAEFWAESWAEYLNSSAPRAVSKAWGDWFITYAGGK